MLTFEVPTMTCGHCVRAITEAVQLADATATVSADLPAHRVQVDTTAPREAIVRHLVEAGYTPT